MQAIKEIKDNLDYLGSQIGMKDATIQAKEDRITELEEELENCGEEDQGSSYKICGETIMIRVDNIAHETFFELLEEKSKRFSINELVSFLEKLS